MSDEQEVDDHSSTFHSSLLLATHQRGMDVMHIFISAGEPSGDLHGANLVRAFKRLRPDIECVGFGGEKMEAAGCRLLYPLCQLAVIWFARVFARAPVF